MTEDELLEAYGVTRSQLHRGGQRQRTTLQLVVDRDGLTCWRCGRPIDPSLSGLDDLGLTLGHRRAAAMGGGDDLANLGPEHRVCNLNGAPSVGDAEPVIVRPI